MEKVIFWYQPASGYIRVDLDDKGLPNLVYPLNTPMAKKYSGFRLILKDLKNVKEAINELGEVKFNGRSSIVKQSLSFYSVITYGKCFAEAKGRGTQLNQADALKYATPEQSLEHTKIIDQRNNYVAHSGHKAYEHNPIVMAFSRDPSAKGQYKIHDNIMGLVDIDSQLKTFEGLVDAIIKYVKEKCSLILEKVQNEVAGLDIEEIYSKLIDPNNFDLVKIKVDKK